MACTHGKCEPEEKSVRPQIALCVMVKNEEKTLPRLIVSVRGFVDKIIVLDTGSTDGTVSLLRDMALCEPGFLEYQQASFLDFGRTRTQLMEFAKGKADWLLLLDADHTLEFQHPKNALLIRSILSIAKNNVFSLCHAGNNRYWVPRLVRGDRVWQFVGATHEYLDHASSVVEQLPGVQVVHHADGGFRADKFERDVRLLEQELAVNPKNVRAMFYLANTYRDLNLYMLALKWYRHRVAAGGWDEEVFVARLEAAKITKDPIEFWETWAFRPTRAEPLYFLEQLYHDCNEDELVRRVRSIRRTIPVPKNDILFVDLRAYAEVV